MTNLQMRTQIYKEVKQFTQRHIDSKISRRGKLSLLPKSTGNLIFRKTMCIRLISDYQINKYSGDSFLFSMLIIYSSLEYEVTAKL